MKYEKPSMVALAAATKAIQSHDLTKTGMVFDILIGEPNPQNSTAAYEADE